MKGPHWPNEPDKDEDLKISALLIVIHLAQLSMFLRSSMHFMVIQILSDLNSLALTITRVTQALAAALRQNEGFAHLAVDFLALGIGASEWTELLKSISLHPSLRSLDSNLHHGLHVDLTKRREITKAVADMQPLSEAISFNPKTRRGVHPRSSVGKSPVCQQTASGIDAFEPKSRHCFKHSGFDVDTRQPIFDSVTKTQMVTFLGCDYFFSLKLANGGSPLAFTDRSNICMTISSIHIYKTFGLISRIVFM
jgi:hypothetical protein